MKIQPSQQPKIQFGKCPFCEKEILKVDAKNNPIRQKGYSEFWVALSDGSRMKVAICEECKKKLTEKEAEKVLEAHRVFWAKGIESSIDNKISELEEKKQQDINYYNSLTLVKYGLKERDLE